jgi:uncharacterized protein
LDRWNGQVFVSLVGFMFLHTRVMGIAIPFHTDFEEVNLRFYVRRKNGDTWQRGVVFVKEIVPSFTIATVADLIYGEKYIALPMRHKVEKVEHALCDGDRLEYAWKLHGKWNNVGVHISGSPQFALPGSEEEFITEHYWGYTAQHTGATLEYRVDHPSWQLWPVSESSLDCDVSLLYGSRFANSLKGVPASAFLAEGSSVAVYPGSRIS